MECVPNFKPWPEACVCGCGLVGQLRKKQWQDGLGPHVVRCGCRRCKGGRTTQNARRREHKVAKAVGGTRNIASGAFGGVDTLGGVLDCEETANESVIRGLRRWWYSKSTQAKVATLMSRRLRPRAFVASWAGRPQLVVIPFSDLSDLCDWALKGQACDGSCHPIIGKGSGPG